jgi:glycosyltransferase involved in cell wall biosynthesis
VTIAAIEPAQDASAKVRTMTVSVAIATYNRAPMVCEAVQAALAQSRVPEEIVISDDASTDGTVQAVESLGRLDRRVRLVKQAVNTGGVANWNAAIEATRGDLIAWCSDDDQFLPGHLQASAEYLEDHPEIGLVHSGFVDSMESRHGTLHEPRRVRPESVLKKSGLIPYFIRYYDWPFHGSTLVMRRSVWEQVGPFDAAYQFSDTEWFLRVVEKFPVASLAHHGVLNRRHPGNWSNRLGSAHLQREVFEIVEASIRRNFRPPLRMFFRALWRANVRVRLTLTLHARLKSGHEDAARAAWHGLLQDSGRRSPEWVERLGGSAIHRICAGREPRFRDPRQSVSPL